MTPDTLHHLFVVAGWIAVPAFLLAAFVLHRRVPSRWSLLLVLGLVTVAVGTATQQLTPDDRLSFEEFEGIVVSTGELPAVWYVGSLTAAAGWLLSAAGALGLAFSLRSQGTEPSAPSRPALVPELYVSDLGASLEFYVGVLGFRVEYDRPEQRFAALRLGPAQLMLEEAPSLERATPEEFASGQWRTTDLEKPFGRGINLEIQVPDIEAIGARVSQRAHPQLLSLHERSYRVGAERRAVRQLLLADPDGYLVRLCEPCSAQGPGENGIGG